MTIHPPKPAKRKRAAAHVDEAQPDGRVFGYARVSTAQQVDEGESLDVQQRTIAGYAMQHGMTIEKTYVERGVSGSKPLDERPEGGALISELRRGDTVITPKLDRMFRSALDALGVLQTMKDNGIALHMIDLGGDTTTNGVSKLVFTILSAVAEAERDRTRERITEVKRDQKQRGRFLGGTAPFGYRKGKDGALVPVPKEQRAIARMQAMRAGGASLRAISEALWTTERIRLSHVGVMHALAAAEADAMTTKLTPKQQRAYDDMRASPGILFDAEGNVVFDGEAEATGATPFKTKAEFDAAQAELEAALDAYGRKRDEASAAAAAEAAKPPEGSP